MKKFMILAASMLLFSVSSAYADNDRPIQFNQLPEAAQQFINTYFPDQKVSFAKEERDFMEVSYEVMFTNSIKIEFAGNGEWKEVKCKYSTLPEGIVPQQITDYVKANFPEVSIYAIDRGYREVEVNLTNGLELTFDNNFNLVDIDD
ncbi:MAG TPA: PepSY-like domain-containing protein [Candidatus Coprenecus stercoravium]|uniref:PepSY-like domain-containing protein n=1 Tax=Candidatus Coprenecus stercoravium TaxID=2840735 RepID=A0A9D2GPH7_9BACT|nr:PepSY-like domain-containing protein [Candidatus Coprenecus stercoravium]